MVHKFFFLRLIFSSDYNIKERGSAPKASILIVFKNFVIIVMLILSLRCMNFLFFL